MLSLSGCAEKPQSTTTLLQTPAKEPEKSDPSCSYFYFLWGSHAEYNQSYTEALEAYEKAYICDPTADYIAEKIPVLLIQLGQLDEASQWLEDYIKNHPENTAQRFMLARLKIEQGKENEAITLYNEALALDPKNNNIKLRLGLLYSKGKQYKKAEEIFINILQAEPESYFATLYLARLYSKTGQLKLADTHFQNALKLNWSKDLSFEMAEFYNLQKRFSEALKMYQDVLKNDSQDEGAALGVVQVLLFLDKGKEALEELAKIKTYTNNPERIDLVRSQILINMGQSNRAKELLESLLKSTSLFQANYLLGVIYYEEHQTDKALIQLKKIPASAAEFKDSILLQVRIHEEEKKSDKSIELLKQVIADKDAQQALFYSLLASIFQKEGNTDEAVKTLSQGVDHFPQNELLLYDYAIQLEKIKKHEKAFDLMNRLIDINPAHADALNFIGYTWADRNIHLEKAYEYIQRAIEIKPQSGYIQDSLGWVLFRQGQLDQAKTAMEKAIELEPDDPFIHEHLGDVYRALNIKDKARAFYLKAIELLSDEDRIEQIRQKIDGL